MNDEGTAVNPTYVEIAMFEDRWGNHVIRAVCPTTGRWARKVVVHGPLGRRGLSSSLCELGELLDQVLP